MASLKIESEDMRIEDVCTLKSEALEEQTDPTFRPPAGSGESDAMYGHRMKLIWTSADIERLTVLVSERRLLFDPCHQDYKHIDKRDMLWQEIAEKVGYSADEVKAKWRCLRDTYTREKRRDGNPIGQSVRSKKIWKYAKIMEFLSTSTDQRRVTRQQQKMCIGEDAEDGSESEQSVGFSAGSASSSEPPPPKKKKPPPQSEGQQDVLERLLAAKELRDQRREEQHKQHEERRKHRQERRKHRTEDEVNLFLQSLAPVIRRMPPSKQSAVKMRFHQVLHELEYGQPDLLLPSVAQHSPALDHQETKGQPPAYPLDA